MWLKMTFLKSLNPKYHILIKKIMNVFANSTIKYDVVKYPTIQFNSITSLFPPSVS